MTRQRRAQPVKAGKRQQPQGAVNRDAHYSLPPYHRRALQAAKELRGARGHAEIIRRLIDEGLHHGLPVLQGVREHMAGDS